MGLHLPICQADPPMNFSRLTSPSVSLNLESLLKTRKTDQMLQNLIFSLAMYIFFQIHVENMMIIEKPHALFTQNHPFSLVQLLFLRGPLRVAGVMRHRFGAIVSNVAWWSSCVWGGRLWGPKVFGVWGHVENYVHSCWRFLKWIDEVGLKFWKSHLILMKVDHSNWVLNNSVFSGWKRAYLCLLFLMKECLLASLGIHDSIRLIGWTVGT